MYEVYAAPSPNVYKITVCLAELGQEWQDVWLDVAAGEQHAPAFMNIAPNGRVPVLVDDAPVDGDAPEILWESGAILFYLAEKHGRFLPAAGRARSEVMTWLFWQMGGLGPMSGQNAHFLQYDPPGSDYSQHRYHTEVERLYRVLDKRLAGRDFICGDYSVADMACYPWVRLHKMLLHDLDGLPALSAWADRIAGRDAVTLAYRRMEAMPADHDHQGRTLGKHEAGPGTGRSKLVRRAALEEERMPRIAYPDPARLSAAAKATLESTPANVTRMMAVASEPVFQGLSVLGSAFIKGSTLSPQLREIAILRVGYLSDSAYETFQHEALGRYVGLSDDQIAAIRAGNAAALGEVEGAVLTFVDDVVRNVRASDANLATVRRHLDDAQVADLILVTGFYMMISRFLETTGVDMEGETIDWDALMKAG